MSDIYKFHINKLVKGLLQNFSYQSIYNLHHIYMKTLQNTRHLKTSSEHQHLFINL